MEATITSGIRYPPLLQGCNSTRFLRFDKALFSESGVLDLRFEVRELPPDRRPPWNRKGSVNDDDTTSDDGSSSDGEITSKSNGETTRDNDTTSNKSFLDDQVSADAVDDVCDIFKHTQERKNDYYAISFTWGQSQALVPITLDGHEVYIRHSAEIALKGIICHIHGSPQHSCNLIWIDAVCIHQADLEEKQSQIALMGIVFSHASTVFAWLGPDEDLSASKVLESINLLAKQYDERQEAHILDEELDEEALPSLAQLKLLRPFFLNPWFSRLWSYKRWFLTLRLFGSRAKCISSA